MLQLERLRNWFPSVFEISKEEKMKKITIVTIMALALIATVNAEASEFEDYDVYEFETGTCLQMETGTCVLFINDKPFVRMDLESCDLMIGWDNSGDISTTMTSNCRPILTDEDDGLSFYECEHRQTAFSDMPAIDYGPNVRSATYRPNEDESLIEPATGFITIDMNDIGGSYMVLNKNGDMVSMGNAYKEIELEPGMYYIIPEEIDFYSARPIIVEVKIDDTEEVTIRYQRDLSTEKGTLFVDLIPPFGAYLIMDKYSQLVAVGFDSDQFRLEPGDYTVIPQELQGFVTPKNKVITVEPDGVHYIRVHHKSLDGTPFDLTGTIIASL